MTDVREEGLLLAGRLFAILARLHPTGAHRQEMFVPPTVGVFQEGPVGCVVFNAHWGVLNRLTGLASLADLTLDKRVLGVLMGAFQEAGLLEVAEAAPGMTPPPPAACLYDRRLALQDELKRLKALSPAARAEEVLARARSQEQ